MFVIVPLSQKNGATVGNPVSGLMTVSEKENPATWPRSLTERANDPVPLLERSKVLQGSVLPQGRVPLRRR